MSAVTPLESFFAQFANLGFSYRRSKTAHNNFERLRRVSRWEENSTEFMIARVDFDDALVQQFNFVFGTGSDLESWQKLCAFIEITPVPDNIKDCRTLVWDAHVNIIDLLECARTGKAVQKFATLEQLKVYTTSTKKFIRKKSAYAGGLLKDLLREILNPYYGRRRNGSEKRKRRKARNQAVALQSESA